MKILIFHFSKRGSVVVMSYEEYLEEVMAENALLKKRSRELRERVIELTKEPPKVATERDEVLLIRAQLRAREEQLEIQDAEVQKLKALNRTLVQRVCLAERHLSQMEQHAVRCTEYAQQLEFTAHSLRVKNQMHEDITAAVCKDPYVMKKYLCVAEQLDE
jgi:DNA repair exonuclease SbcCD ATPase subunit